MKILLYWDWSWRNSLGKCFKYLIQTFSLVFYIVCSEIMQQCFREKRISKSVTSCPLPSSYLYREEMKDECYMTRPPVFLLSSVFLQDYIFLRPVKMSLLHSHDNQKRIDFHQDLQCLQGEYRDPLDHPVGHGSLWQTLLRCHVLQHVMHVLQQQDSQFSFYLFGISLYWLFWFIC